MSVRARRWGWRLMLPVLSVLVLGTQLSPLTQAAEPPESDLTLDVRDRVDPVAVGNTITYDLRFRNQGPDTATGMRIVQQLPPEVEFLNAQSSHNGVCTADGSTVTCDGYNPIPDDNGQGIAHINVTAIAAGTAQTTAVISSDSDDPNSNNNDSGESTFIFPQAQGDLEATKTGPSEVTEGTTYSYQLRVINHGPHTARGVKLTDQLPSGVEFAGASTGCANSGGTVTCTAGSLPDDAFYDATINVRATTAGTVSNTATASGDSDDPNSSNDESAAVVTVIKEAPVPQADLSTTKSGPANVKNGETFSYGLTATNGGPDAASGASVSDLLPAGVEFVSAPGCANNSGTVTCSLGNMAPGSSNFTITVRATSAGTLTNTATATSSTQDPDGDNNTSNSVVTEVAPVADLSLTKSGPADAETGESLTYTLSVANAGPDAAAGVTVSDTLPSSLTFGSSEDCTHLNGTVTCALGTIASGGGDSASFTATSDDAGQVVNSASVTSDTHDPSSGNNSGSATTTVTDPPPSPTPTEEPTPTPTEEPTPTPTEEPTPTPTEEPTPTPTEEPTPTPTQEPTPTPTEPATPPPAVQTTEPTPTASAQAEPPPEPIDSCPTSSRQAAAGFPTDGLLAFVPAAIQLEQQRRRKLSLVDDRPSAGKRGKRSRSKIVKIVAAVAVVAVAAVVGVLLLTGGDKGKNYATLGGVEGRVDLQKPQKAFEPASKAATLDIGDKVRTGADGLARIDYTDGSLTRLDHNTTFQVQELINDSTHKSIKTNLEVGRIWNRVEKLTKQEDRFEVKTVTAVATVEGTTFVNDCRFNGGLECSHIGIEGTFHVTTEQGDQDAVSSGDCKTEEGDDIGPCRFTEEELENDPFFIESAKLDKLEKGDIVVLPEIFGDKKAALVPVEDETQVQATEAPTTTAPATEEPSCPTGESASGGTSLPLAGAIALMVIFFGVAWARPNRKSDPADDSAN